MPSHRMSGRISASTLGTDSSGWNTLGCDPRDGRLWERTYPQREQLHKLNATAARASHSSLKSSFKYRREVANILLTEQIS